MTPATFFQHFDLLADQPDAVARMRELVLQLAVRGQLVEQNSKDEPAQKLVERARRAWPERKVRERLKAEQQAPPYALPAGWTWTCLDEIGDTNPRNEADDKLEVGFAPMKLIPAGYGEKVSFEVQRWGEIRKGFTHFADGDVVLAKITPCFENGKSAVIRNSINRIGAGTTELHVFRQYPGCVVPDYVLIFFKTPKFINEGVPRMTGSAGQKRVPWDYFANTPFPLPPLAEQKRIVAKVEELLALCDELAARQQARQHARAQLTQAALHRLTAPSRSSRREPALTEPKRGQSSSGLTSAATRIEPDEFRQAAAFVLNRLPLLTETPEDLPQLRQAILSLAVQGRLVPQNPKDEGGAKLVARLSRKELPDANHVLDEKFPASWGITAFTNLAQIRSGVTKGRNLAGRKTQSFPYLRVANVQRGYLALDVMKDIEIPVDELEKFRLRPNDLLLTEGGDWDKVGRTAIWRDEIADCIHQNHVFRARLVSGELQPEWFMLYFNSPVGRRYFETAAKQTTNLASINASELRECPVPVPPLAEQKRIVARVEALLRQCDGLEAQLHQTRTLGAHLLDATLHHLLAA